jgi:nucleoside-diphosphate-sugar epimerase
MNTSDINEPITTPEALDEVLSRPSPGVAEALRGLPGDILVLGAAGKMGPSLARMARRAADEIGDGRAVIAVSRFSEAGLREKMESWGIRTIAADLLNREALAGLPDAPNIVYMAGRKFGSTGAESLTWAMNAYLPGMVAERYPASRITAFSTGNVYPFAPASGAGASETDPVGPVGEYAQSCLGRERILEHFSAANGTPVALLRLSYAIDLRYGVILDVAAKVLMGEPVDVTTGYASVIWQGDANAHTLMSLASCSSPPMILNITGPRISIRDVAVRLGELLERAPRIVSKEADSALLVDASKAAGLFGPPSVSVDQMLVWTAEWVKQGNKTLNKPTHFEARDGKF